MRLGSPHLLLSLSLLSLPLIVLASSGDRSSVFQSCLTSCSLQICPTWKPSVSLFITRWTCTDECKYSCMHQITSAYPTETEQYYGKWPFWRLLGMQEPASVLFSLANLAVHIHGVQKLNRTIPKGHPMKDFYVAWAFLNANAWIWSAVFHTRDLPRTEKLDYFSAALAVCFSLHYTIIRIFHLYTSYAPRLTTAPASSDGPSASSILGFLFIVVYFVHITYLSLPPRFDYTYNMIFNLTIGMTHNLLWVLYSIPPTFLSRIPLLRSIPPRFPGRPKTYHPKFTSTAVKFVVVMVMATGLELFDFPPWGRTIDAHALWHLATVPIAWGWYRFLIMDARDESWRAVSKPANGWRRVY